MIIILTTVKHISIVNTIPMKTIFNKATPS